MTELEQQMISHRALRHCRDSRCAGCAGDDVPAGTVAVVRSPLALRCIKRAIALHTLIHKRHPTPSCGGHVPTAERTVEPGWMIAERLRAIKRTFPNHPDIGCHYMLHELLRRRVFYFTAPPVMPAMKRSMNKL